MLKFGLFTSNTEFAELLYISIETRLEITMKNQFQYFVLTKVVSKNVIIIILENICIEITSRWYIDSVIKIKKTIGVYRPLALYENMFCSSWITRKGQTNILIQDVKINNYSCTKERKKEDSSLNRSHDLSLSKNRFEVVRVDCSVASILLFKIDILLFGKSIQFGTKMTRIESNNKVELKKRY